MLANWNCFKPPRIDFFYPSQGWLVPVAMKPFLLEISVIPCCNRCRGFLAHSFATVLPNRRRSAVIAEEWEKEASFLEIIGVPDGI